MNNSKLPIQMGPRGSCQTSRMLITKYALKLVTTAGENLLSNERWRENNNR